MMLGQLYVNSRFIAQSTIYQTMILEFMAELMESYGTLIKINLYFDHNSVIGDFL